MDCLIFIDNELIRTVEFKIIDPSMGAINGNLICSENYNKFQKRIQEQTRTKGSSNSNDFNYRITTKNKIEIIPQGGTAIIDSPDFNELFVECAGIDSSIFEIQN